VSANPRGLRDPGRVDRKRAAGTGFKPHERVQLVVAAGQRSIRRTTTGSASGTFTMRVPGVDVNDCAGFSATATGGRGSRATFKRPPGQCPVP
jgi:hypothetical protein